MFEPLLIAPVQIQIHVLTAVISIFLGPFALFRKRRDRLHKVFGYVWVAAMALTALTSLFIFELRLIGLFSPIHLLSLVTLAALFKAVHFARHRQIANHRQAMQGLSFWALAITLFFTVAPGRIMSKIFFNGHETAGFMAALVIIAIGAAAYILWRIAACQTR